MFNLVPDKSEISRYLGIKGETDAVTMQVIGDCVFELQQIIKQRYIYGIFDIKVTDCIELKGTELTLTGGDIYNHLKDCEKCTVMAATLGIEADNAIRIAQSRDMLRAVVMDASASEYIEKLCDCVEDEIKEIAAGEGYNTKFRFSPGYGDLPLGTQKSLLDTIDAGRKIGITLTSGNLMTPSKSVTAVIGFTKNEVGKQHTSCDICSMKDNCKFRKEGKSCGRNSDN